jgi:hypothetical protein
MTSMPNNTQLFLLSLTSAVLGAKQSRVCDGTLLIERHATKHTGTVQPISLLTRNTLVGWQQNCNLPQFSASSVTQARSQHGSCVSDLSCLSHRRNDMQAERQSNASEHGWWEPGSHRPGDGRPHRTLWLKSKPVRYQLRYPKAALVPTQPPVLKPRHPPPPASAVSLARGGHLRRKANHPGRLGTGSPSSVSFAVASRRANPDGTLPPITF